jgi:diguanylate cyclase (GGDEF)-like protein/PAS domain S-box-containing protein
MRQVLDGIDIKDSCQNAFVNPTFDGVLRLTRDGGVFAGAMTFGDGQRVHRGLTGRAWFDGGYLVVVGEMDVQALERLNHVLIGANREIHALQRELVRKNRLLEDHVADLDRQKRLHEGFAEIQQAILNQPDEDALIQDLCDLAVRHAHLVLAWVGLPSGQGSIQPCAASGRLVYLDGLEIRREGEPNQAQDPAAVAYRTATRQIVNQVGGSDLPQRWQAHAQAFGIAAVAAFPLCTARGVIGVLTVYADRVDYFGADETRLLDRLATNLALAIEASRQAKALYESESRYRLIFDHVPLGLVHYDRDGCVVDCNRPYVEIMGVPRDRMIGQPLAGVVENLRLGQAVVQSLTDGQVRLELFEHVQPSGQRVQARFLFSGIRGPAGEMAAAVGIVEDDSERRAIEQRLRTSEERLKLAVEAAGIGVWDLALPEGSLVWDPGMWMLHGLHRGLQIDRVEHWEQLVHPDDRDGFAHAISVAIRGQRPLRCDFRVRASDGDERHLRSRGRLFFDDQGVPARLIGICYDVTERKQADEQIYALAFFDPLTRLANRRLLLERIDQAQARSSRRGDYCALLLMDIDFFKRLNDAHGHDGGDALLVQIAMRLKQGTRETDLAARLGGDEFVVLCEGLCHIPEEAAHEAALIGEKIGNLVRVPFRLGGDRDLTFTASIGVTLFRGRDSSVADLMKQADIAMYQAKRSGRASLRLFQPEMQLAIDEMTGRERALRRAVADGDLQLLYQPQVDQDGRWVGCEALLRWTQRDGTTLSPAQFLPQAETSDLMPLIGDWVVQEACRDMGRLAASNGAGRALLLGINCSARQLVDPDLTGRLVAIAEQSGFPLAQLRLEISESALFSDFLRHAPMLARIRQLGVGIELDDFGSGYSSLVHLRRLALDAVKIDQGLVATLDQDPGDAAIVRAAIGVASALAIPVIAEGVERESQRRILKELGCRRFQGYLFGRPMPLAALKEAFAHSRAHA